MNDRLSYSEAFQRLRENAERLVKKQGIQMPDIDKDDLEMSIHELEVYHSELELQNEELRRTKSKLETSRDEFFDLYEFAPVAYLILSKQGIIEKANQTARQMFKKAKEFLLGSSILPWIYGEDVNVYYSFLKRLASNRKAGPIQLRLKGDDGPLTVLMEAVAKMDEKDGLRWHLSLVDITKHKQVEEALRESLEWHRMTYAAGRVGSFDWNLTSQEAHCSEEYFCIMGRTPRSERKVSFVEWQSWIYPYDRDRVLSEIQEALDTERNTFGEYRVVDENGEIRWISYRGEVVCDAKGCSARMFGTVQDITERKGSEEALRESEERFRVMADGLPLMIWVHDAKGHQQFVNRTFCQFFGVSVEEIYNDRWQMLLHPDDADAYTNEFLTCLRDKRPFNARVRVRRADGQWRWVESWGRPRVTPSGKFLGIVGTSLDITESKKALDELRRSRDELEVAVKSRTADLDKKKRDLENLNKELKKEIEKRKEFETELKLRGDKILAAYRQRDFLSKKLVDLLEKERHEIGSALHDQIGQILTGVVLQLEELKAIRTEDASDLSDRVNPIQNLLRKGMTQARNISQNLRSDMMERFGLIPSIEYLIEEMQKYSGFKIHLFTKNISQDLKDIKKELTIYRVVQESLTNVLKYAKAQAVFINLIQRGDFLFLTIEDDGAGFDYDALLNQEDSSDNPLGITIMRERVSMLGGEFRIESQLGKGTSIHAQIPLNE